MQKNRDNNRRLIIKKLTTSKKWKNQFKFVNIPKNIKPSWMGLPILISEKFKNKREKFINYLEKKKLKQDL